ncbi:DUF6114 domain-containing protein [Streptomyces marispadix]|uniref:DUF6114 domain-containing protein n=1 Tax=Streptomyces marispadix TaxID=2922868 RepID=A0ABS9T0I9_9ACTN|nr:DUF6114 domain-containing protein [Streptomyces marispadix]MCH6162007.1 DUF6114 domain-containing protein [Streptomyces marispadix]
MLLSRPRNRGDGGRAPLGAWLDDRLPWPGSRAAARNWRRRRPFWAGLLLMASGAELIAVPLSPFGVLVSLGVGGIAAMAIGLALILAGGFLWAAPHARAYVSLNALLLSVLSFAATNLGGFVLGTALGIAGSAMGFGWTPGPDAARKYASDTGCSRDAGAGADTDADSGTGTDGGAARVEGDGGPGDGPSARSAAARFRSARRALAVALPLSFLGAFAGPAAPEAHAVAATAGDAGPPPAANTPATITTSRFTPEGFTFAGTEEVRTAKAR